MSDTSSHEATNNTTRRGFLAGTGALAGGMALAACGGADDAATTGGSDASTGKGVGNNGQVGTGRKGDAADTLFIAGHQWGAPTNFNTFSASPAWPTPGNNCQYIYETLLRFDIVTGELLPGLAKEYTVSGTDSISVTLQDGTTWQDGSALTPDDVLYTFELGKLDPSLGIASFWNDVDEVAADGTTISFAINQETKAVDTVLASLAQTYIVPKAVFEKVAQETGNKLAGWETQEAMGSGPFKLESADATQIILTRHDDYWGKDFYGGVPVFSRIIHPIFKSNEDANLKFQNGELDVVQSFIPQIWKMWEQNKPVGTYLKEEPYFVPGSAPMFIINTTRPGLDDPAVRRALATAVDYDSISETAMSGYSERVRASLIIPTGAEGKWLNTEAEEADGWSYDAEAAEKLLQDAGYAKGSDGIYAKGDVRLGPWKLITPQGWTDWNAALEIVSKNFQAIGIDAATNFPQAAQCGTAIQNGDFDAACYFVSSTNPNAPLARFVDIMSNVDLAELGTTAYRNYGRWQNDEVSDLITAATSAADDDAKQAALDKLDDLYRQEVPAFPLMYRPDEFFEYNATNFVGWPDENNDYAAPTFRGAGNTWLFGIEKIGA